MKRLLNKIALTIVLLLIYRLGTFIPLPGIDAAVLEKVTALHGGGILGMFNMFTGGALNRMSIFSLNIMPYITSSIILQLFGVMFKEIGSMRKEGESGRRKLNQYTRYLAILLAISQGFGLATGAEAMEINGMKLVTNPGLSFRFIATLSMLGGTVFVIWLTDQISTRGLGNGTSLVIFSGIVSGLPGAVPALFNMARSGATSIMLILFIALLCFAMLCLIVFCERSFRKISITYPKRQIGNKIYNSESTYLPLKINTSGVLAPIFASALLLFPTTIIGFMGDSLVPGSWQHIILLYFGHGKVIYIILYAIMIFFFSFFYTNVIFNPDETSENLKKAGAIVMGHRPGIQTSKYINKVLNKLTFIGAVYLTVICVIPELLMAHYAVPFYLGGTSLLIVVNVVMDIFQQIQTYMLGTKYTALLKQNNLFAIKN